MSLNDPELAQRADDIADDYTDVGPMRRELAERIRQIVEDALAQGYADAEEDADGTRATERVRIVAAIRARYPEPIECPNGYVNPLVIADFIERGAQP